MENRTITYHFNAVDITTITETTGVAKFYAALGYLTTWNFTFSHVDIYLDGETDLVAVYRAKDGSAGYTIGAVWHSDDNEQDGGHYGFHS